MASRFLRHRLADLHPYEVQATILHPCDLKCRYCRCPELKTKQLRTEQWASIFRRLGELGTIRMKFQGGEPTLRPDFRDLCELASDAGMLCAAISNGQRIARDPSLLDGLDEVVFSLDSVTPAIHDTLRGAGTHELVVEAIRHARERNMPTYVVMVVNRDNFAEMEAVLDFCDDRGVGLHCQPVLFGRDAFDDTGRDLALTPEQFREMHLRLAAWKNAGRPLMFSAATYANVLNWQDHSIITTHSVGDSACMAGRFYVHIEPDGDVWPCQQHGADFTPKNCVRDGVDEALRYVRHHNCGDCFTAYLNERKAVFGLRPSALMQLAWRA
jgi:MoaA/NifB/PqqE/SkfB family radical SAM enzyme